jgi:hypothetical protein
MLDCNDIRKGRFRIYMERNPVKNFNIFIPNARVRIKSILLIKYSVSISIPTDIKKSPLKLSLKGNIVVDASWAYSDSEITRPARNAPSAKERPNSDVRKAIPKHRIKIVTANNSRLLVRTI